MISNFTEYIETAENSVSFLFLGLEMPFTGKEKAFKH